MMVDVGVLLSANRYNSWLQSRRKENLSRVRVTNSREKTSMLSVIAVGLCKLNDNVVKVMLNFRPSHPTTLKYFYTQHRFSYLIHIPIHNNYNSKHFMIFYDQSLMALPHCNLDTWLTDVKTSVVCWIVAILVHFHFWKSCTRVGLCRVADGWVRKKVGKRWRLERAGELEP